jgi:hypothetical protein
MPPGHTPADGMDTDAVIADRGTKAMGFWPYEYQPVQKFATFHSSIGASDSHLSSLL